jgi:osmoprotectant transport system ATP-binding protein
VGADRGLKRLSLIRVRDVPLEDAVLVTVGEEGATARQRLPEGLGPDYALLVDEQQRPLGWIDRGDLAGDGPISRESATPGAPTVQPETPLRDALSAMLASSVQLGVVVDEHERVLGLISVDAISDVLRATRPVS